MVWAADTVAGLGGPPRCSRASVGHFTLIHFSFNHAKALGEWWPRRERRGERTAECASRDHAGSGQELESLVGGTRSSDAGGTSAPQRAGRAAKNVVMFGAGRPRRGPLIRPPRMRCRWTTPAPTAGSNQQSC
jgi:hypothetical protein